MGKAPYFYSDNLKIYQSYGETKIPYLQVEVISNDYPLFIFSDIAAISPEQYIRRLFDSLLKEPCYRTILINVGDIVEFIDNITTAYIDYWNDLCNLPSSHFC